jgi:branched-chain amino acid transport system substrate-binding protein
MRRSALSFSFLAFALALTLASCGLSEPGQPSGGPRVLKIGFITTLQDTDLETGVGARNSLELAVRQANAAHLLGDWRLVVDARNDKADPAVGAQVAGALAADPAVVGVVDSTYSSVSAATIPVLARANIVQVSSANTNPGLTLGPFPTEAPKRVWPNYFRLVTNDLDQGRLAADHAWDRKGYRRVATVNDQQLYGQGLVTVFEQQWRRRGGRITSTDTIEEGQKNFGELVGRLLGERPEFVYYGGGSSDGAAFASALYRAGFKGNFMGGDAIASSEFVADAGGRDGMLSTSIGQPLGNQGPAKRFTAAYNSAGFAPDSYNIYGPLTYDAGTVLIKALATVLPKVDSVAEARPLLVQAMGELGTVDGVTGQHSFDQFGDTQNRTLTVSQVSGGDWKVVFAGPYQD